MMHFLRSVLHLDNDRDRRLGETAARVHHARRMMDNALEDQSVMSRKIKEARESLFDKELVSMIEQLGATLDKL